MRHKGKIIADRILLLIAVLFFAGCGNDDNTIQERDWQLVWQDEFEGEAGSLPNADNWDYDIGTGDNGWGNQELQYYTNRPENVSLDGEGNLNIIARFEAFEGQPFTSARIKTQGLFQQTYGRFEARIKTPFGPGIWPAFWMLGADVETVGWPQTGEIDIMEMRGQFPSVTNGSVHGPGYSAGNAISRSFGFENQRFDTDFHLFAVEWGVGFIDFYVDDRLYQRITPEDVPGEWVFNHDFFILLNVAVGGTFVGFPTEDTPFPQTMAIDYVRVYTEVQ